MCFCQFVIEKNGCKQASRKITEHLLKRNNYKILGMHFIYHTRFCEFDGWRPPKHEPIMVIGMWLNNRLDPLEVDLKTRLELYKKFFPDKKYKFDCSDGVWPAIILLQKQ